MSEPAPTAWILTDGKAGDESQCLGVTQALSLDAVIRRVAPRPPFSWFMPYCPIDPRDAPDRPSSPIAPPFPDLVVASGRRAVPYLRRVKRDSKGASFTVFLKDPRTGESAADLIWVAEHDSLRSPNVLATATAPHRISPARLAAARATPDPRLATLAHPRVAVLAGGDSRHHRFTGADIARFGDGLAQVATSGAGLMITASRRTPERLRTALDDIARRHRGFLWDGSGENPYAAMLALADFIVVSADSSNMIGEAAATGRPVLVFSPSGGHPKLSAFVDGLAAKAIVHPFTGRLVGDTYEPVDSTAAIAQAIAAALARHRAGLA